MISTYYLLINDYTLTNINEKLFIDVDRRSSGIALLIVRDLSHKSLCCLGPNYSTNICNEK